MAVQNGAYMRSVYNLRSPSFDVLSCFKLQSLIFVLHHPSPRLFMARKLELLPFVRGELYALSGSSKQPHSTEVKLCTPGSSGAPSFAGTVRCPAARGKASIVYKDASVHLCVMHQTSQTVSSVSFVLFILRHNLAHAAC